MSRQLLGRPADQVARDLVGARLVVDAGTPEEVRARLVEVEAYLGLDDAASHAFGGPTPRASIMFGEPGRLYVYFSYGMHHCANVVCAPAGTASAVLLRAAVVEGGEPAVRSRRGASVQFSRLLSGPGNLCRGLAITRSDNGSDLCADGRVHIERATTSVPLSIGPRVGISRAHDLPLRFWWTDHPAVSAARSSSRLGVEKKGTGSKAGP
ncbi:MAG: DNA-3-methyladenine glycosylase [Candidatus Dormibacteraeota bacterium]|uniref:Putative 3-methyladenine DNA glycosylase n=1 Tax=Candidatus Amunia macphersoniae TaxID=3127014 RepID=A0A934NAI5_9BACT|nr:DNA-3-methyladenine glycosylase [Candidatus Dormibacteraeota bacterium]